MLKHGDIPPIEQPSKEIKNKSRDALGGSSLSWSALFLVYLTTLFWIGKGLSSKFFSRGYMTFHLQFPTANMLIIEYGVIVHSIIILSHKYLTKLEID